MTTANERSVLTAIDRLYDASTNVDKWGVTTDALAEVLGATHVHVGFFDWQEERLAFNVSMGFEHFGP